MSKKQSITLTGPLKGCPDITASGWLRHEGREEEARETRDAFQVETATNTMVEDPGGIIGRTRLVELMAIEGLDVKVNKPKDPTRPELYVTFAQWEQL